MNTTDFASELNTDSRTARKFLRSITPKEDQPGKGSRWSLPDTKRELNKMKKQFAAWTEAQVKAEEPTPDEVKEIDEDDARQEDHEG